MNRSIPYALEQARKLNLQKSICVAELVQIIAFYPDDMTVDVKPMVMAEQGENFLERPPILKVPVMLLGSKEIVIRPWYQPGDIGVIVYLDRDSDNVLLSGMESEPQTTGYHTGEHAVFLGTILVGDAALEMPENHDHTLGLGTPTQYISISPEKITISIDKKMEIKGRVEIEGELTVNGIRVPE